MEDRLESIVDQVFVGRVRLMLPDGEATGIFKTAVCGRVRLTTTGLEGDEQADLRHHGGVDKALHHYPVEHYALMAQEWPQCADMLGAGVLGENVSTRGMTEHEVCIGDILRIGEARVQVSQPRAPCWKIDRRLKVDDADAQALLPRPCALPRHPGSSEPAPEWPQSRLPPRVQQRAS